MFLFTGLLCGTPSAPARAVVDHGWHVPRAREGGAWGCAHGVRDTLRDVGLGVKNKNLRSAKKKKLHSLFKEFRFPNRDGRHSLPRGSTINLFFKEDPG